MNNLFTVMRYYVALIALGLAVLGWIWYEYGWKLAGALFVLLWANNASMEMARRAEQQQRLAMVRSMADARKRIRDMAGQAAPGGDARIPGGTNTEAEVTGRESP